MDTIDVVIKELESICKKDDVGSFYELIGKHINYTDMNVAIGGRAFNALDMIACNNSRKIFQSVLGNVSNYNFLSRHHPIGVFDHPFSDNDEIEAHTFLQTCAMKNAVDCAKLAIKYGADMHVKEGADDVENGGSLTPIYIHPLMLSASYGSMDFFKTFVSDENIILEDSDGNNLLHYSVCNIARSPEMIHYIVDKKPELVFQRNKSQIIPLTYAIQSSNRMGFDNLLKVTDPEKMDFDGLIDRDSPIHIAAHLLTDHYIKALVDRGWDINQRINYLTTNNPLGHYSGGFTPLHSLSNSKGGNLGIGRFDWMIELGADMNAQTDIGETIEDFAIKSDSPGLLAHIDEIKLNDYLNLKKPIGM